MTSWEACARQTFAGVIRAAPLPFLQADAGLTFVPVVVGATHDSMPRAVYRGRSCRLAAAGCNESRKHQRGAMQSDTGRKRAGEIHGDVSSFRSRLISVEVSDSGRRTSSGPTSVTLS